MRGQFLVALTLCAAVSAAHALGFGEINLNSALNQPLRADIPLLAVKPSERDAVSVQIATQSTFQRFGVPRSSILDNMQVSIVPGASPDRMRVLLTSRRPIREPFLTFLLEAEWPEGRAIREYTVLLDPPVSPPTVSQPTQQPVAEQTQPRQSQQLEQPATATPQARSAPRDDAERPTPAAPQSYQSSSAQQSTADYDDAPTETVLSRQSATADSPRLRRYGPIAPQETLWSIALEVRPDPSISMDQMLLAIYLANPQAFDGNMNLMRKGAVLKIPRREDIVSIDRRVASQEVADQKVEYRRLRQGARASAIADAPAENRAQPSSSDASAASPEQPQAGELRLEPADGQTQIAAADSPQREAPEPDTVQEQVAAAQSRPDTQSEQPAEVLAAADSQAADTSASGSDPSTEQTSVEASDETATEEQKVADTDQPGDETGASGSAPDSGSDASQTNVAQAIEPQAQATGGSESTEIDDPAGAQAQTSVDQADDEAGTDAAAAETGEPRAAADDFEPAQATQQNPTSQAVLDEAPADAEDRSASANDAVPVTGDTAAVVPDAGGPLITARRVLLALAALLLIISLVLWRRDRQYKPVPADFASDEGVRLAPTADPQSAAAVAGSAAGLAAAGGANDQIDDEQIDVDEALADADSHIENELYDEALSVLGLALEQHPGHPDLQHKILQAHHAAGERDAFVDAADAYFPQQDPDDPQWRKVAVMGRDLAPDDNRFADVPPPASPDNSESTGAEAERTAPDVVVPDVAMAGDEAPADMADQADKADAQASESEEDDPFDFGFDFDDDEDPVQAPASEGSELEAPAADSPPQGDADTDLSAFDLDDWGFDDADEQSSDQASVKTPEDDDSGLGADVADAKDSGQAKPEDETPDDATQPESLDDDPLDFDISDFGLDDESESTTDKAPDDAASGQDTPVLDIGDLDLDDDDSDLSADATDDHAGAQETESRDPGPSLDLDTGDDLDQPDSPAGDAGQEQDLNFDLAGDDQTNLDDSPGSPDPQAEAPEAASDDEAAFGLIDDNAGEPEAGGEEDEEVATKLDLARAYLDMGEPDMAVTLLNEVKSQGSEAQQREADTLLERAN